MLFIRAALLVAVVGLSAPSLAQNQPPDWPKAGLTESGFSDVKLRAMENAIRSGEFKKIGSVLVARHGKLVY